MPYAIEHPLDFRMTDPDCRCGVRGYAELFEIGASEAVKVADRGNDVIPYRYGVGWIFCRYTMRLLSRATPEAPLELTTWISSRPNRRFMNREFQVRQKGEDVCLGRLESCFLDLKLQKVVLPEAVDFPDSLYEESLGQVAVGPFRRLDRDPAGAGEALSHQVRFSDLDNNGHMNNLQYVNLAMDAFTREELDATAPQDFEIHFLAQCRELETLKILRRDERDGEGLVASDIYLVGAEGNVACRARVGFRQSGE